MAISAAFGCLKLCSSTMTSALVMLWGGRTKVSSFLFCSILACHALVKSLMVLILTALM